MIDISTAVLPNDRPRTTVLGLLLILGTACSAGNNMAVGDPATPGDSAPIVPTDTVPADSALPPPGDSIPVATERPGIVFGSFGLDNALLGDVHTGAGRVPSPNSILRELADARAQGARFLIKLAGGADSHIQNADGTFSFEKWKAMVGRYETIDFNAYVVDGTVLGHYLLDEPNLAGRWGGQTVPQVTIEAMAQYSKELWPEMITVVRAVPSWLDSAGIAYHYLDAGWAQYAAYKGDPAPWLSGEVGLATRLGLGLVVSLNVLDGGDGSSGVQGTSGDKFSMTGDEIRTYGTALLTASYACAFFLWRYDETYFARPEIVSAMADLSILARNHVATSCRQ